MSDTPETRQAILLPELSSEEIAGIIGVVKSLAAPIKGESHEGAKLITLTEETRRHLEMMPDHPDDKLPRMNIEKRQLERRWVQAEWEDS